MPAKIAKIKPSTFQELTTNVWVVMTKLDIKTFSASEGLNGDDILGSTTGGINFNDTPSIIDRGEDIDNCPPNTKELADVESREVACSGNFVTVTPETLTKYIGTADIDPADETHITVRDYIDVEKDFYEIYLITDYGVGGYIILHLMDVMNTNGLQITTAKNAKGQFAFNFRAFYSLNDPTKVPYEAWLVQGDTAGEDASGEKTGA